MTRLSQRKNHPNPMVHHMLENLASAVTKFWQTEARNEQKIKKLKNAYLVALSCPKFYVPTRNEEIIKNKSVHHYYRRIDKQCFDLQNVVLKATAAVVDIGNSFLEANKKNELILSKDVVVKVIDTITLLGKVNPTSLYSSNSKASTSTTHSLNFQVHKKNFQRPQPTTRRNQKQEPRMESN